MNFLDITVIGPPEPWLIEAAASIGLDYSAFTHEVTDHFKNHVINRHGNPAKHGAATVTNTDFDRIPAIVKAPDMAIIGAIRQGNPYNVYIKIEMAMTYLYFDEVLNSKRNKALRSATLYKGYQVAHTGRGFEECYRERQNGRIESKGFDAKVIKNAQPAGGNPGGEAW